MRKESLKETIKGLALELAKLEELPEDDFVEGDVIQFKRRFPGTERPYTYVAVKIGEGGTADWWVSSRNGTWTSWDDLCKIFSSGQVTELWFATGWEEIELP